jgi:hypothetical protein
MHDRDRLVQLCAHEVEQYLAQLFAAAHGRLIQMPFVGGFMIAGFGSDDWARQRICRALLTREKFRREAPWAPILPLLYEGCKELTDHACHRIQLVGHYGWSCRSQGWCREHPAFHPFCAGVLADPDSPAHLRNDRELLAEFGSTALDGITDGWIGWRSPATLAADRLMDSQP